MEGEDEENVPAVERSVDGVEGGVDFFGVGSNAVAVMGAGACRDSMVFRACCSC